MTKRIDIAGTSREKIAVNLIGVEYVGTPPKGLTLMRLAKKAETSGDDPEEIIEMLAGFLVATFGKKQADAILKRLDDPEDDMDIKPLTELFKQVAEAANVGNPTT